MDYTKSRMLRWVALTLILSGFAGQALAQGGKPLKDDGHVADGSHYPAWICIAVGTDTHQSYAHPTDSNPSKVLIESTSHNLYTTCGSAGLSAVRDCQQHDSRPDSCRMKSCEAYNCNVYAGEKCADPVKTVRVCN